MPGRSVALRLGGLCIAASLALVAPAHALTISDGNSSATIDPSSPVNMSSWVVNGVDHYSGGGQQSFYYSIGNAAPRPITNLGTPINNSGASFLDSQYAGSGISLEMFTFITGGNPSAIGETATLRNATDASIDIHFYEYVAFNVNGKTTGNTLTITNGNTADQTDPALGTIAEVDATSPSHFEGATGDTILSLLNNGSNPVTLSDSVIPGSGNPNFAFEWDATLTAAGTDNSGFQVSINKTITNSAVAVPLPKGAWMALISLAGLALVAGKKKLSPARV
jgi:hypothetical protein